MILNIFLSNIGILIDIVDTISNSNVLVVRTLYSTTDLDFGSHRAHRVGGAKHSLVISVAKVCWSPVQRT